MTQFWRLFTSDYVQDFVDSKPIPTKDEIAETYTSQFNKVLNPHKQKVANFFQKLPSFKQFIAIVKDPTLLQVKKTPVSTPVNDTTPLTQPVYSDQGMDLAFA